MTEEKKLEKPRQLKRILSKKFSDFEDADYARRATTGLDTNVVKAKIVKRPDGTFDLITYCDPVEIAAEKLADKRAEQKKKPKGKKVG